ncbi:CNVH-domain-containing protein [Mollisia scopiformis]|uniref:CNVH-domain-containing protein n=1 Tax=Mollisia scopiformis TaxID=149040 RepID=A0A194WUI7_MOLSC|nr:CNVH-domain-containing protein [Mollisia scopiformis]KUJ11334.1 CNVH-domain-containing protein [Mollisia scopiformis]
MSFKEQSRNIRLEGTILRAECSKADPSGKWPWHESELRLDRLLGNVSGQLVWLGTNFNHNAKHIYLEGTTLHALLPKSEHVWHPTSVDLNDRIANKDGRLVYADPRLGFYSPRGQPNENEKVEYVPYSGVGNVDDYARRGLDATEAHAVECKRFEAEIVLRALQPFRYTRLPTPTSIRLLKIEDADEPSDFIHASLVVVDLAHSPQYDALSYTWGSPFTTSEPQLDEYYQRTTTILCNNQRLSVKQNLLDALRRLRKGQRSAVQSTENRGRYYKTPLIQAAEDGHGRLVHSLLLQGADITAQDRFGETALHYAAERGHLEVVKTLVQAGSSVFKLDNSRRTPLDCAKQKFRYETIKYLETQVATQKKTKAVPAPKGTYFPTAMRSQSYIWIDALCINQEDNDEKAIQVGMMGRIYKSAKSVVVWLGRERQDVNDTTAEDLFLDTWMLDAAGTSGKLDETTLDALLDDPQRHLSPKAPADLKETVTNWIKKLDEKQMRSWLIGLPFFRRSWFERAWVIQELVMAQEITVLCGQFVFSWDTFVLLSCAVDSCRVLMRAGTNPKGERGENFHTIVYRSAAMSSKTVDPELYEIPAMTLERRRRAYHRQGALSSMSALALSRNYNATDTRDKVFAVLSISAPIRLSTKTGTHSVLPDYVQPARDLFVYVAMSLLQAHGPSILSLIRNPATPRVKGLPSWVPDLTMPIHYQPLGISIESLVSEAGQTTATAIYDAIGNNTLQPAYHVTAESYLVLHGFRWDSVQEIAQPGLSNIGPDTVELFRWGQIISELGGSVAENRAILWRTLISDEAQGKHPAPDLDKSFQNWLKYLCFIEMTGIRDAMANKLISMKNPVDALWPKRSKEQMLETFQVIQPSLATLGITFTKEDVNRWRTLDSFSPEDIQYANWYFGFEGNGRNFAKVIHSKDLSRRIFRTGKNFLGIGPEQTEIGDLIYLLPGTKVPYVFRHVKDGNFRVIGEAYVHGIMHGEAWQNHQMTSERLCIV